MGAAGILVLPFPLPWSQFCLHPSIHPHRKGNVLGYQLLELFEKVKANVSNTQHGAASVPNSAIPRQGTAFNPIPVYLCQAHKAETGKLNVGGQ